MIAFTVPGLPQGKGRPRVGKINGHARMFTPAKTVAYESTVRMAAHQARDGHALIDIPVRCRIVVSCQVPASWSKRRRESALAGEVMPTAKPDLDNVAKAILDGCNGVLWRDDVLVVDLLLRKRYAEVPGVQVEVMPA